MRVLLAVLVLGTGACSKNSADPKPEDTRSVEAKPAQPRKLRVAAAADLTKAFGEVAAAFKAKTGTTVEVQFGAGGPFRWYQPSSLRFATRDEIPDGVG